MTHRLLSLAIAVERREVHRNLGYGRARAPSARTATRLDELWPRALGLIDARGMAAVVTQGEVARCGMPEPTEPVGVGLCTIGGALEAEVEASNRAGALLDSLLLDAFGSAAAEAAADALCRAICEEASARGFFAARRMSPGYGKWDVRWQRELLSLARAEDLGVSLTDGMMMVPQKSVSFVMRFDRNGPAADWARRRCADCSLANCAYRCGDGTGSGSQKSG